MEIDEYYLKKFYYDSQGKLIQYPSKRPLREIVLGRIAKRFEADYNYTEKDVNEIIRQNIVFNDIELIRRELYQWHFLNRLRDGSAYWLEKVDIECDSDL